ncbi:MAG TPA: hypothetical protein PLO51_02795, partial [Candidatus Micrarchaeota archaeon]|nr:hypothetical protein [Candidatus Micrarchaeota archaeon]
EHESQKQPAQKPKKEQGIDYNKIILGVAVIAIVAILAFFALGAFGKGQNNTPAPAVPATPTVTIYKLTAPACTQCKSYDAQVAQIKSSAAGVTFSEKTLDGSSAEAKQVATQYGVTRAPAVIMTGATDKISAPYGWATKNGVITSPVPAAPYLSISSGKVAGLVDAVIVYTPSCTQCIDLSNFTNTLKQNGVVFSSEKTIDAGTPEGQAYVQKYGVNSTPFLVLSEGFGAYGNLAPQWYNVGRMVGSDYVMDVKLPPYYDLTTGQVRGLLTMTVISDKACADCSDLSVYKNIFENTGVKIDQFSTVDISDSAAVDLAKKYNVSKLPTFILSGDLAAYGPGFEASIQQGGTLSDGVFVFTNYTVIPNAKYVEYTPNGTNPTNKSVTIGLTILPK